MPLLLVRTVDVLNMVDLLGRRASLIDADRLIFYAVCFCEGFEAVVAVGAENRIINTRAQHALNGFE